MRRTAIAVALLLLGTASFAPALVTTSNVFDMDAAIAEKNANLSGNTPTGEGQVGGEDIGSAVTIGSLPFSDTGNTCGFLDNYDEVCPFSGSTSPDVVYAYSPSANQSITIDLCSSLYDTKVYVYENSTASLVACNDDAGCGITTFQSLICNLALTSGNTYYIVVDGYLGDCGDYTLNVTDVGTSCVLANCPAERQVEGEPPCGPGYVDTFNGGCNSSPPVFTDVTCGTICGKAGTFVSGGFDTRDTDWYRLTVGAGTFSYSGVSNGFPLRLFVLTATCPPGVIATTTTFCCEASTPLMFNGPGTFYLFAGTNAFDGVPCESEYLLTITGPGIPSCQPTATESATWGQVKGLYR